MKYLTVSLVFLSVQILGLSEFICRLLQNARIPVVKILVSLGETQYPWALLRSEPCTVTVSDHTSFLQLTLYISGNMAKLLVNVGDDGGRTIWEGTNNERKVLHFYYLRVQLIYTHIEKYFIGLKIISICEPGVAHGDCRLRHQALKFAFHVWLQGN